MFLCLLLFTIKVSQGKFVSVLPPPHTPSGEQRASVGAEHLEFTLARAARPQPKPSHVLLHVCVSHCLCACPVAAQPHGCSKSSHSIEMPLGNPKGTLGAEQEPISALRVSWSCPLHQPSGRRTACAQTGLFLPQSYIQWFTGEVQFQVNLIKSVTLCTGPLNPETRAVCSTELHLNCIAGILM